MRFWKPVDVTPVNAATITMRNRGLMQARVVPVENCSLAFLTPTEALKAGTDTVLLAGVRDGNGFPLANTEIRSATAGTVSDAVDRVASGQAPQIPEKEDRAPTALQSPTGVTALAGVVRTIFAKPLPMQARVVPVENGALAFVTPAEALKAGTEYTVLLAGVRDGNGFPLANTEIRFATAGTVSEAAERAASGQAPRVPEKEDPAPPALQGPAGVTALAGVVRTIFAKPLPNANVNLDCAGKPFQTVTDAQGRFLLMRVEPGRCQLEVDGILAKDSEDTKPQFDGNKRYEAGRAYGRYFMGVDLVAGRTLVLPYTVWMTPIDRLRETPVAIAGLGREQVITHPELKGLELRIPANAVIRDHNGGIVDRVSITPVPAGRTPFPMPKGVSFATYFTIQPGGAYVEVGGSRYAPGRGATLVYPNRHRAPAGTKFNFWNYDPENGGWHIYGTGRVTGDRRSIVPDAGVVIGRFTGAMVAPAQLFVPALPSFWPNCRSLSIPAAQCPPCPFPECDGDPVALSTGLFVHNTLDLHIPDRISVSLTRTYRTGNT